MNGFEDAVVGRLVEGATGDHEPKPIAVRNETRIAIANDNHTAKRRRYSL
jgi:hypothetical protein